MRGAVKDKKALLRKAVKVGGHYDISAHLFHKRALWKITLTFAQYTSHTQVSVQGFDSIQNVKLLQG